MPTIPGVAPPNLEQPASREFVEQRLGGTPAPTPEEPAQIDPVTKAVLEDGQAMLVNRGRLGYLFETAFSGTDANNVNDLAELTRLDPATIRNSYDIVKAAVARSKNDPAAFERENPDLAKFLLQNLPSAAEVLRDPAVKKLTDDLKEGDQVVTKNFGKLGEVFATLARSTQQILGTMAENTRRTTAAVLDPQSEAGSLERVGEIARTVREQFAKSRENLGNTWDGLTWVKSDESLRRVGSQEGRESAFKPLAQAWQNGRAVAAEQKSDTVLAAIRLLNAKTPQEKAEAEQAMADARAAVIRARQSRDDNYYAPNAVQSFFADAVNLTASSAESGAINAAGGAVSLGIGVVAPEAKAAQGVAMAATRVLAAGSEARQLSNQMFNDLSDALPDSPLEERVAISIAAGAAGAAVSVIPGVFNLKAWGAIGEALATGNSKAFAAALTPNLRQAFARAGRKVLLDAGSESLEEMSQDVLDKALKHQYTELTTGQDVREEWGQLFGELAQTGITTATGMAPGSSLKLAASVATSLKFQRSEAMDAVVVDGIREAASGATGKAPQTFAGTVAAVTKDATGTAVENFYVDPQVLFQQEGKDPNALAVELMGETGPRRLQQAMATGQNLEVPLAEWAAKWERLLQVKSDDITAQPGNRTLNQRKAEIEEVEAEAKRIVEAAKAGNPFEPRTEKEAAYIAKLERQLSEAPVKGKLPDADAVGALVAQHIARLRTASSRWGMDLDTVLDLAQLDVKSTSEAEVVADIAKEKGRSSGMLGLEHAFNKLTRGETDLTKAADLQRELFLDPNTRLYSEAGWNARKGTSKYVIEYDLEGKKFENDVLGHLTLDGDLRAVANIATADGAVGAKIGSSIFAEAGDDLAAAEKLAKDKAAEMMKVLGGLQVTVAVTERQANAKKQADVSGAVQRSIRDPAVKDGTLAHRKGVPIAFTRAGDPKVNWDWHPRDERTHDPALGVTTESPEVKVLKARYAVDRAEHAKVIQAVKAEANFEITPEMAESLRGRDPVSLARELFVEKNTGLVTQAGWEFLNRVLPPAKGYVSADMRELKYLNDLVKNGAAVDNVMFSFGQVMARAMAGGHLIVSHLHGDEYAARLLPGADPKKLEQFKAALDKMGERVKAFYARDGLEGDKPYGLVVVDGVEIAADIGETFAKADDALNKSKSPASKVKRFPVLERFATKEDRDARIQKLQEQRDSAGQAVWRDFAKPVEAAPEPDLFGERSAQPLAAGGRVRAVAQGGGVLRLEEKRPDGWSLSPQGWYQAAESLSNKAFDEITLVAEQSDFSTFAHESSHQYLKLLHRLSKLADAPLAVKRDQAILLDYLGAKSLDSLTVEQQEKFARASEQYLMDGKAPSIALVECFRRFKNWLRKLYQRTGLVTMSDEVRGVFDRIYATDDEIARVREKSGQKPDLLKRLGNLIDDGILTKAEVDRYYKDRLAAESTAAKAARVKDLKDELKKRKKDISDAKAEWAAEAEKIYDAMPEARARVYLETGVLKAEDGTPLDNSPHLKLDRASVESMLSPEEATQLKPYLSKLHDADTVEPGLHPDDLAERIGFGGTGAELLRAVLALPPKQQYVREQVQGHLDYESDLLEARDQVAAEVAKGLHGHETLDWMLVEWKALAGRAGTAKSGVYAQAIKRAAQMLAEEYKVTALHPSRVLNAERLCAERAALAAAAGNYGLAVVHQERRMLNAALYAELMEAQKLKDRVIDRAAMMVKDTARARLGKADLALRDGVDEILEVLGFAEPKEREVPLRGQAAMRDAIEALGFTIVFDAPLLDRVMALKKSWRTLTVKEARAVDGALRQISKVAANTNTVRVKGERLDLDEVVSQLVELADRNMKDSPAPSSSEPTATRVQRAVSTLTGIEGELLQMSTILDMLGGSDIEHLFRQYLLDPIQAAKHREYDLVNEAVKPIVEMFKNMPKEIRAHLHDKVDGAKLFPNHIPRPVAPTRRFELLTLALNAGNESNLERLLNGRRISQEQLQAAIDTLTEQEMEWVQTVLDANESLWPLSADVEERETGLRPEKIEATPITWRGKRTFRGGYYPAIYDRRVAGENTGERQMLDGIFDSSFSRPGTNHNHLKKRAEHFNDIITLDFRHLSAHMTQVAHDIAFREVLRQAGRIVMHKKFQDMLKVKLGEKRSQLFLRWLKDIGHARAARPETGAREWTENIRALRSNFAVATLGYAGDIAAGDFSNIEVALADRVGPGFLTTALKDFTTSPLEIRKMVLEKSGELRFRRDGLARELRNQLDRMVALHGFDAGAVAFWKENAFAFQEAVDAATVTPVWLAAYRQGFTEAAGRADAEDYAVRFADDTVRRSFPSNSPVDQSAIMRDRGFVGTMLLFHGYFNLIYNRDREDIARIVKAWEDGATAEALLKGMAKAGKVTARVTGRLLGRAIGVYVIGNFLSGRGPAADEPPEEWLARSLLLERLMELPFGDAAVMAFEAGVKDKRPNVRAAPGLAALYEAAKVVHALESDKNTPAAKAAAVAKIAAMFSGIPGTRPIRAAQYLVDLTTEPGTSAKGPLDVGSKLVYGPDGKYRKADPIGVASSALE